MNENPLENISAPSLEVVPEEVIPKQEGPTTSQVLGKIDERERSDGSVFSPDTIVKDVVNRMSADKEQIKIAQAETNFTERSITLAEKRQGLKETFEASVRKALLPVTTAFVFGSSPAFALENQSVEPAVTAEAPMLVAPGEKDRTKELSIEQVFDLHSPLAQSSEMKKKFERPISAEELVILEDLHKKAWDDKNEWIMVSGKNKDGKLIPSIQEVGPVGGKASFEALESNLEDNVTTHTHPVEAGSGVGLVSTSAIREGRIKAFVMPPSAADIGQCIEDSFDDAETRQRIVDPRGVWEYVCDPNHPFARQKKAMSEKLTIGIQQLKDSYRVSEEDFQRAWNTKRDMHPALQFPLVFSELEKKYPGIESKSVSVVMSLVDTDFSRSLYQYEQEGASLIRLSTVIPDAELGKKIQSYIQKSEDMGVTMSFTPFKKLPVQKKR